MSVVKDFLRELDRLVNTNRYRLKIMITDTIDSFTEDVLLTTVAIRDITDYDNPVDIVIIEHWQGQWLEKTVYLNLACLNEKMYCVLDEERAKPMFEYILQRIAEGEDWFSAFYNGIEMYCSKSRTLLKYF